jgi:hypothetical protein
MTSRCLLLVVALGASGCGTSSDVSVASPEPASSDRGAVVATVGAVPIYEEDVRARAVRDRSDARTALDRLIDVELLAAAAASRGATASVDLAKARKSLAVQTLLEREIETPIGAERVSEAEARAFYDRNRIRFVHPERRTSVHLLAEVPPSEGGPLVDVATAFVERALAQVREEGTQPVFSRLSSLTHVPDTTIPIRIERVPALDRYGNADGSYLAALFGPDEPGPLPGPVRSAFGVHGIVLTEIEPALDRDFEEARVEIVAELLTEKRRERFEAWTRELRERNRVEFNEPAIRELVASSSIE